MLTVLCKSSGQPIANIDDQCRQDQSRLETECQTTAPTPPSKVQCTTV